MLQALFRTARSVYSAVRRFSGDVFFERTMGIETSRSVALHELGLAATDRVDYDPSPWLALKRILPKRDVAKEDVFIDFGCGKGRVVVQAAMYPFLKVIGVELSSELHAIARNNVDRSLARLRCKNVELVNRDVLDYEIPDEVTIAYFYNPFGGETFSAVIDRLVASVRRRPRLLRIIYVNPVEEQTVLRAGATLTRAVLGVRPGTQWARQKSISMYALQPSATALAVAPAPPTGG
ncbi:MAG: class I SAM-dependent methyltransferase [Micropepsaceae bacterium]